jgi:hypothetical protein
MILFFFSVPGSTGSLAPWEVTMICRVASLIFVSIAPPSSELFS